jgi:hypothetical protein
MNRKYTKEQIQFLKDNVNGKSVYELTDLFNKEFSCNKSIRSIRKFKERYHLKSNYRGKSFKNGHHYNYKPIGSERICNNNGYQRTQIKVGEHKWVDKQRYLYEKYIAKIPKGYEVIFLDGNKDNFELSNLALISNKEHGLMSKYKIFFKDKDLNETSIILAKLKLKMKEVENE